MNFAVASSVVCRAVAVAVVLATVRIFGCRISEFYCDNGECVGLDKYCDGTRDCQDGSDETRLCTRCNRTYYGDRHKTYHIEIAESSVPPGKLPYLCMLTFMAGGSDLGDIVELSFDRFDVGRLQSGVCIGGRMQILERTTDPETTGAWCGRSISVPVYYSETNNVSVALALFALDKDQGMNFDVSLKFRYLSKQDAVTRYGPAHAQYHRGEWIPTSVCDRIFQDCDSQPCKVHSPNYPGLYPRNVTCLYHVTQRTIPRGKHAFIVVQQQNEDKLSVKADVDGGAITVASREFTYRREKTLLFGDACRRDYVAVFDGADMAAPLLARFCRSGALTAIVSSGPEVVIEFRSSPADSPDVHHFELDVEVLFLPENDVGLRTSGHGCDWVVRADERRSGIVHSLRHLAAPNTSCAYHLRGRKRDVVWLYFVKYFVDTGGGADGAVGEPSDRHQSLVKGALYDGDPTEPRGSRNATLLAAFDNERPVRLCVHARSFPNFVPLRPCRHPEESYLSTGPDMFLRYNFSHHFGLHYLRMEARFEFVDTSQDGDPAVSSAAAGDARTPAALLHRCDRVFRSARRAEGTFSSPKNLFLYGRGGRRSIRCSYEFVGQEAETVRLVFWKIHLGNRKCDTVHDLHSRRYVCQSYDDDPYKKVVEAEVRVAQVLHGRVEVPVACLCQLDHRLTLNLTSGVARVNFTVTGMTSLEDFDSFYFDATYEFSRAVHCDRGHVLDGNGGEIAVPVGDSEFADGGATVAQCPWLLPADFDQFVHLRISGATPSDFCETNNRVIVFAAEDLEPIAVVCPAARANGHHGASGNGGDGGTPAPREVEVYTKSWNRTVLPGRYRSNTLLVEFHASEPGEFYFKWSRVVKSRVNKLLGRKLRSDWCADCADSESCATSRCDAKTECRTVDGGGGVDGEGASVDKACVTAAQFPWLYVGIGIGCGVLVTMILVASLLHRRRETKAKKGKPVPTDEYPMDGKELDC